MLRLFRKNRQQHLSKNKVGKYLLYAVGEITLIVLGILLAIQVGAWNQAKKDRIEERIILTRLSNELSFDSQKLSTLLKGLENKEKALEQVSMAFTERSEVIDSIFLLDVITSSLWGWTVQALQRLIYEEINNTGRLVIVRNIELRNNITKLYNYIQVAEGTALARTGDYARLVYAIIPRENETQLK